MIALRIKLRVSVACTIARSDDNLVRAVHQHFCEYPWVPAGAAPFQLAVRRNRPHSSNDRRRFRGPAPFGFLSVIDILTPPRVHQLSTEANWGIGSASFD
jgi:hypothetical protein